MQRLQGRREISQSCGRVAGDGKPHPYCSDPFGEHVEASPLVLKKKMVFPHFQIRVINIRDLKVGKKKRSLKMKKIRNPFNCSTKMKNSGVKCKHDHLVGEVVGMAFGVPRADFSFVGFEPFIKSACDMVKNRKLVESVGFDFSVEDEMEETIRVGKEVGFEMGEKSKLIRDMLSKNGALASRC
ncbi:hypothetical protein L6452_01180 [Arctium lappa]|uniref:Uncharacterized protein n=1 Tax=Arctium lappa TaxID=4217 RepID=A0ACB9FG30_ARCLA|nr:hypothetical protein L6452_01180 [Arctium lappa]